MLRDALDALSECAEYLAEREDVVDGSDGQPLSLRAVQAIAKYLHRKLPRRRRTVRNAPLADLARVRKLVDRLGVASTATKLGVSRRPNEAMSLLLSIDRTIAKLHKAVGRV